METIPSFKEVRRELVGTLICLAGALEVQVRHGAGTQLLDLPKDTFPWDITDYDTFDLSSFAFARGLEAIYRYAFFAELDSQARIDTDSEEGNLGGLNSLIEMVWENPVIAGFRGDAIQTDQPMGGLKEMVRLGLARYELDFSSSIELPQLALLAGVTEPSCRNALFAKKDSERLVATRNLAGELEVSKFEALRWLRSRNLFRETKLVGNSLYFGDTPLPEGLNGEGVMQFIRDRLQDGFRDPNDFSIAALSDYRGWPEERLTRLFENDVNDIDVDECPSLAMMLGVDLFWFAEQVIRARFPERADERVAKFRARYASPLDESKATLDITLTEAGIRNGYFDIERRYADRLFPADSFGERGAGKVGHAVTLEHDGPKAPYITDWRIKSKSLVSPRKRFSAYFSAKQAVAGDSIRITRTGERSYRLEFIRKNP